MLRSVAIRDYMSVSPVTLTTDMPAMRAIQLLVKHRISGAPVLDLHGNLVGVLTQKDCLNVALSTSYHEEVAGNVADYMSRDIQSIDAESNVMEAIEMFLKWHYHRFPVMEENRLVGVISQHDILRALDTLRG